MDHLAAQGIAALLRSRPRGLGRYAWGRVDSQNAPTGALRLICGAVEIGTFHGLLLEIHPHRSGTFACYLIGGEMKKPPVATLSIEDVAEAQTKPWALPLMVESRFPAPAIQGGRSEQA